MSYVLLINGIANGEISVALDSLVVGLVSLGSIRKMFISVSVSVSTNLVEGSHIWEVVYHDIYHGAADIQKIRPMDHQED